MKLAVAKVALYTSALETDSTNGVALQIRSTGTLTRSEQVTRAETLDHFVFR